MKEVQNKWSTLKLNDDIWAKLIYFERNRRLAKAYVSAPVLTVDGSTHGLDGFRIGLSGIDNMYRSLESMGCLRSISHGIKLKIDNRGNILIRKIGQANSLAQNNSPNQCSVWVKDWPSTTNSKLNASLNENCMMREIEKSDISYKLFDMRKFRLQLERHRLNNDNSVMDWRQCVSIISFVRAKAIDNEKQTPTTNLLEDPCWLMIINIIAIDMLKSIVCDRNSPTSHGATSLVQNHSLLESRNNLFRNNSNSYNNNSSSQRGPMMNSSSASTLFPSTISSTMNQQVGITDQSGSNINSMASSERIKKLRTANNRYRSSPVKNSSPHYRRYQSTLQLSSNGNNSNNSTIYTTFNSKFINSKSYTDNSSTSDYNSATQSTSSGHNYWYASHQPLYPIDSLQQRVPSRLRYREEGKAFLGRKSFVPSLETTDKSLSLSAFDLSQRRLDLRSIKSSIKMNYNHLSETEDCAFDQAQSPVDHKPLKLREIQQTMHSKQNFHADGRESNSPLNGHAISHPKLASKSELNKNQEPISCCCEQVKNNSSSGQVNHSHVPENACCRPIHGGKALTGVDEKDCRQKVSKSSIASSSSSSGCADNDYFMSHSSSSMSSSTASNERELLSQPASSSGIVCSGNTSDEYDENQPKAQSNKCRPGNGVGSGSSSPKSSESVEKVSKCGIGKHHNPQTNGNVQMHRRGYKIKTVEPAEDLCCKLSDCHHGAPETFSCSCPPVEVDCGCCCDCFQPEPTTIDLPPTSDSCRCDDDESIYSRLPHPTQTASLKAPKSNTKKGSVAESGNKSRGSGKISPMMRDDSEQISTIPMQSENEKSTMAKLDGKQPSGWLEKRKYSRILPKFIFSSSSSNGSRQVAQESKSTQRKSSTLDKD